MYSTCTTTVEENEEVIDWILNKEVGNVTLEPIILTQLSPLAAASQGSKGQKLAAEVTKAIRIPQTEIMEGFFVAKLRKSHNPVKRKHI